MPFAYRTPSAQTMPLDYTAPRSLSPVTDRFMFARVAAERAKQLIRGATSRLPSGGAMKPTTVAMREVRAGLVHYRVHRLAPTERPERVELFDAHATIEVAGASISGGPTVVLNGPDMIGRVRAAWSVLRRSSSTPMESMRQALRRADYELFSWSTWSEPPPANVASGGAASVEPENTEPDGTAASLDLALSLAEAAWRSRISDDPITCTLTTPDSDNDEVTIDAPFGALVIYPGSLNMKLAFKFKKPVGFALAFIRNRGVMPSQLADSILRSLRDAARRAPGVEDLTSILDAAPALLQGKSHLLVFIHGLISTDVGLFDPLIRRFRQTMPTMQLLGYPHNTFSSIETNAVVLADWIEKLIGGGDMPVAFVCHSRGGLVARTTAVELKERNKSWQPRLRGCVTFGTPHEGAAFSEVAEDFYPTFASLATLSGTRNVLSSIDVLTYYGAGGKFEGIEDLRPLTGAGSTRDRFLKTLREREGRERRINILAFGGRIEANGRAARLMRRFLAGLDSDQVVELSSSTPAIFDASQRVVMPCNHFEYFVDSKANEPNLTRAQKYIWDVLHDRDGETISG